MQSQRRPLSMKKKLILPLSLLFAMLSTGCASLGRTELAPIPVDPEWRPGLLGLVANSLAEEYERPVSLWGREGGSSLKGSCRAGRRGVTNLHVRLNRLPTEGVIKQTEIGDLTL